MMFLAIKTEDGVIKGKISFYCQMLKVTRQGFYKYLADKDRPWKYQDLADAMRAIASEDECNDTYGRIRMYQALLLKQLEGIRIPGERTVYRVMGKVGISHRPKRKLNEITKADCEARKSDDLPKRDFSSKEPLEKCVTDITEISAKDGKLYVSAIFDCFDAAVLKLVMDTSMKAALCERILVNAVRAYPALKGAVIHSDRGIQYTSDTTVAKLLSEIGDIRRSPNANKLANFVGIAPVNFSSLGRGDDKPSKQGNRRLQGAIYFLAIQIIQLSSKGLPRNPVFYAYYQRQLARGKTKPQALILISRRLINIIYGMLKNKTEYHMSEVQKIHD